MKTVISIYIHRKGWLQREIALPLSPMVDMEIAMCVPNWTEDGIILKIETIRYCENSDTVLLCCKLSKEFGVDEIELAECLEKSGQWKS